MGGVASRRKCFGVVKLSLVVVDAPCIDNDNCPFWEEFALDPVV